MISLPVPVSPWMRTVVPAGAASSTCARVRRKTGLSPMISSKLNSERISSSRYSFSTELVFERVDLLEGQGIFEGDGDLHADLLHQFNIGGRKRIGIAAGEIDGAERAAVRRQW